MPLLNLYEIIVRNLIPAKSFAEWAIMCTMEGVDLNNRVSLCVFLDRGFTSLAKDVYRKGFIFYFTDTRKWDDVIFSTDFIMDVLIDKTVKTLDNQMAGVMDVPYTLKETLNLMDMIRPGFFVDMFGTMDNVISMITRKKSDQIKMMMEAWNSFRGFGNDEDNMTVKDLSGYGGVIDILEDFWNYSVEKSHKKVEKTEST